MTTTLAGAGCVVVLVLTASAGTSGARAQVPPPSPTATSGPPTPAIAISAPADALSDSTTAITATVTNATTVGEIAVLERLDQDTWTPVSSSRVGAENDAVVAVPLGGPASYSYRVRLSATTEHKAASSETVTIEALSTPSPEPSPEPAPEPTPEASVPEPVRPADPLCGGEELVRYDGRPWVCTYDDEFDDPKLDRRFWVPQLSSTSRFYTGTPAQPACLTDDSRTIDVRDGDLVLGAVLLNAPVSCGGTTSSRLVSGMVTHHGTFAQTYGRYEVRAKVPDWKGKGLQETFWLWPVDQLKYGTAHPASGEIDFGEFYSTYVDLNVPVIHYLFDPYTISYATNTNIYTAHNCRIQVGEFNTYTLEWDPGQLRIFVNDKVCIVDNYIATNAPPGHPYAPFDSPFFLALTQAFGTTGNEFDPTNGPRESSTLVDYVRIWA